MRIDVPVQLNVNAAPVSNGGKQPFAGLSVGDSVSAEVLSVSSDGIVLLTEQGETIHAENLANVPLQPGDQLELLISSRNDGQLSTKLVSVNGQSVSFDVDAATARLLQLGIQPTAANLNLAAILAKAGAPVNADTFQPWLRLWPAFPICLLRPRHSL